MIKKVSEYVIPADCAKNLEDYRRYGTDKAIKWLEAEIDHHKNTAVGRLELEILPTVNVVVRRIHILTFFSVSKNQ